MFTFVCRLSDLQEGELMRFDVQERALLVIMFNDGVFVSDSTCTHEEADLSLGIFFDGTVKCPLHGAMFRIQDGGVVSGPDGSSADEIPKLRVYVTKVENGEVFADL